MRTLGNIIWFLVAGFWSWISWSIVGIVLCITVIGIPFGVQCFKLATFGLFPFGKEVVPARESGCGSLFLNIIWILLFGWELALMHLLSAFLLCITIIGIPFASQCVKLAMLSLMPFGTRIRKSYY